VSAAALAVLAAVGMIAQLVAGKTVRDAMFLSAFGVGELPRATTAAAILSLLFALVLARLLARFGPARVVPVAFAVHGGLYALEAVLYPTVPQVAAVLNFFHTALLGSAVVSGFYSVSNERFDPHTAKRTTRWIVSGATFGGVIGGAVTLLFGRGSASTILPGLAVTNLVIAAAILIMTRGHQPRAETEDTDDRQRESGAAWLRRTPYIRLLAILTLLVTFSETIADYVLKFVLTARTSSEGDLVAFFSVFHAATALVGFFVQTGLSGVALGRFGLAGTLATRPAALAAAGLLSIAVPVLGPIALLRGLDSVLASSLFRSAYEILYTPLSPQAKRATKSLLDIALVRVGDALGAGLIAVVVLIIPELDVRVWLVVAVVGSIAVLFLSRKLHTGYVETLAVSLKSGVVRLADDDVRDRTTRTTMFETAQGIDRSALLAEVARRKEPVLAHSEPRQRHIDATKVLEDVRAFLDRDLAKIDAILARPLIEPELVGFVARALDHPEIGPKALVALERVSPPPAGLLGDLLLDGALSLDGRIRAARALFARGDERAASGLWAGVLSDRFEVSHACARLLWRLRSVRPNLVHLEESAVFELVEAEIAATPTRPPIMVEIPEIEVDVPPAVRRALDGGVVHVIALLGLTLDPEASRAALRALATDDVEIRGTALAYLENVIPEALMTQLLERVRTPAEKKAENL